MTDLNSALSFALADRYSTNAARIRELAAPLTNDRFWQKPFPYGNSFGHLVLHLTGNLNYYIGAQIAQTGYVRDRPQEFNDANPPSKDEALKGFDDSVTMVVRTLAQQSADDWSLNFAAEASDCKTRLAMVVQCCSHMQHHIGQMIYLVHELQRLGS
jgi:uncharacterized damage-inducible protein DinB